MTPEKKQLLFLLHQRILALKEDHVMNGEEVQLPALIEGPRVPGPKIRCLPGKTIVEAVRLGVEMHPYDQTKAAEFCNTAKSTFSLVRKLIILQDNWNVSHEDREKIKQALEIIERDKQITRVRNITDDIINRNWIKRKDEKGITKKRARRFEMTILNIRETCASTTDVEIPQRLGRSEAADAIAALSESVELISKLIRKLVGERENGQ